PRTGSPAEVLRHTARDREEEVASFARWVKASQRDTEPPPIDRIALVVRRPLPYVYLTRELLRSAGVACQMFDALPLAGEPYAAALDLTLSFVTANYARPALVALLRSAQFRFSDEAPAQEVRVLDRALNDAAYLG